MHLPSSRLPPYHQPWSCYRMTTKQIMEEFQFPPSPGQVSTKGLTDWLIFSLYTLLNFKYFLTCSQTVAFACIHRNDIFFLKYLFFPENSDRKGKGIYRARIYHHCMQNSSSIGTRKSPYACYCLINGLTKLNSMGNPNFNTNQLYWFFLCDVLLLHVN